MLDMKQIWMRFQKSLSWSIFTAYVSFSCRKRPSYSSPSVLTWCRRCLFRCGCLSSLLISDRDRWQLIYWLLSIAIECYQKWFLSFYKLNINESKVRHLIPKDGSNLEGYNVHVYIALSWILIYARLQQKKCKMQLIVL